MEEEDREWSWQIYYVLFGIFMFMLKFEIFSIIIKSTYKMHE